MWLFNHDSPTLVLQDDIFFVFSYISQGTVLTDGSLDTSWGPTFNTILHSNSKPLVFNCCLFFLRRSLKYHHVDHYYVIKSWARDDCKLLLQQFLCSRTNAFSLAINSDVIYSTEDDLVLSSRVTQSLGRRVTAGVPFLPPLSYHPLRFQIWISRAFLFSHTFLRLPPRPFRFPPFIILSLLSHRGPVVWQTTASITNAGKNPSSLRPAYEFLRRNFRGVHIFKSMISGRCSRWP